MSSLVSICIPTYNGEKYLQETLDSISAQTYKSFEVIISDDNSKDSTIKIAEAFRSSVNFPVYIYSHKPNGIGANWNNCVKKSNGEFIKFIFQDDILHSNCIEKMLISFNESVDLLACRRGILTHKSEWYENAWKERNSELQKHFEFKDGKIDFGQNLWKSKFFLHPPLNKIGEPSTWLFRKKLLEEIGGFSEKYNQILDFEFCCRVLEKGKIRVLEEELISFRVHDDQATNKNYFGGKTETKEMHEILLKKYFFRLSFIVRLKLIYKNFFKS